jgi:response regulator RpfG family c-di-GMP phosphodiesterase
MPNMSGKELLYKIKSEESLLSSKVILVSSSSKQEIDMDTLGLIDGFIQKPVHFKELNSLMSDLLPDKITFVEEDDTIDVGYNFEIIDNIEHYNALYPEIESCLKYFVLSDVKSLSNKLIELSEKKNISGLKSYTNDLIGALQRFDIENTLKMLHLIDASIKKYKI